MQIDIDQRACAQVTQETQGKVFQTVSQTFGFIVFKKLNLVFKCVIPCFNLTRMGVGAKRLHTSFSTGTSTNVWICPQNFLTFSFKPFATLLLNFKATPSTGPKLLNWIQEHPSKKFIFCSNSNKMVMVTSVIKMLKLPNFGHITKSTVLLRHVIKFCCWRHEQKLWTLKPLFRNPFILRKRRVANFADIIKIAAMFMKVAFKDWNKVKWIRNYILKCNPCVFPDITKVADFQWKNDDVSRTQEGCYVIDMFFGSSFGKV